MTEENNVTIWDLLAKSLGIPRDEVEAHLKKHPEKLNSFYRSLGGNLPVVSSVSSFSNRAAQVAGIYKTIDFIQENNVTDPVVQNKLLDDERRGFPADLVRKGRPGADKAEIRKRLNKARAENPSLGVGELRQIVADDMGITTRVVAKATRGKPGRPRKK